MDGNMNKANLFSIESIIVIIYILLLCYHSMGKLSKNVGYDTGQGII